MLSYWFEIIPSSNRCMLHKYNHKTKFESYFSVIITSAEGGYVFISVCLFVRQITEKVVNRF